MLILLSGYGIMLMQMTQDDVEVKGMTKATESSLQDQMPNKERREIVASAPSYITPCQSANQKQEADFEDLFRGITDDYRHGRLTLGEAADLLGMNRWEYDAQLQKLGIVQEPEPRTKEEIRDAQTLIEKLCNQ